MEEMPIFTLVLYSYILDILDILEKFLDSKDTIYISQISIFEPQQ